MLASLLAGVGNLSQKLPIFATFCCKCCVSNQGTQPPIEALVPDYRAPWSRTTTGPSKAPHPNHGCGGHRDGDPLQEELHIMASANAGLTIEPTFCPLNA